MYFVIVIDSRHHGHAAYFDQTEPTVLKNLRTEATEWAELTDAQTRNTFRCQIPMRPSSPAPYRSSKKAPSATLCWVTS